MKIVKHLEGIKYTLSNESLQKGDAVFPILRGEVRGNNEFIIEFIDFRSSGFPDNPHTIKSLEYSDYKPYEISTDMGYGPKEKYFKIIKREHRVKDKNVKFSHPEWREI
jgi:hypothetical protein